MPETTNAAPVIIPAATVVIFRHATDGGPPELLMVQRAAEMRFAGGAAVFPGGRVDPQDRELAARLTHHGDIEETAARIAGIRETLEETGLAIALEQAVTAAQVARARACLLDKGALAPVLEQFGWTLALGRLVPFARWCPNFARSFDTRFYLVDLGTGAVEIAVDATENTKLFWASARDALAMADAGDISVIFPTRRNLERLALCDSFASAREHAGQFPVDTISPHREMRDGEEWLMIPDGFGYPVIGQPITTVKRGV